jgi:hypothetical protein
MDRQGLKTVTLMPVTIKPRAKAITSDLFSFDEVTLVSLLG